MAFHSQLAMLLTSAYRSLGKEQITSEIIAQTKDLLVKEEKKVIEQDYQLMPAWVSSIIKSLYEEE